MLSGRVSAGQTTLEWQTHHTGHDAAMRAICALLVASMPPEALREACEHLVEAYDFHTENRRLPTPSSSVPVVTSATVTGRVSHPSLVLQ